MSTRRKVPPPKHSDRANTRKLDRKKAKPGRLIELIPAKRSQSERPV